MRRLSGADQYGFDVIENVARLNEPLRGSQGQPAVFSDPSNSKPGKSGPAIRQRVFLMVLEATEKKLVPSASLTHIDQSKIVVVEDIDACLVSEVCWQGRRFFRRDTLQMATDFGASPVHVVSAPKESEVVYEHGHDRQIGQTNSPTKPANPPFAPVAG